MGEKIVFVFLFLLSSKIINWRSLPNRRVEKILGMYGRESSGSKRHHIPLLTSSQSGNTRMSNMKAVVDSWTRKGPLSFQAVHIKPFFLYLDKLLIIIFPFFSLRSYFIKVTRKKKERGERKQKTLQYRKTIIKKTYSILSPWAKQ